MTETLSPLGRFERILLATDGSGYSDGAIAIADEMATKCDARLYIVSIALDNPGTESLEPTLGAESERLAMGHVAAARERIRHGDCITRVLRDADPARAITEAAEQLRADVIIMGRHGRRGLARWKLGHATEKVVGRAPCPVLVVPESSRMWHRKVLLATDGSRYGDAAAVIAGNIAQLCQLPLAVISAILPSHSRERRQDAQTALDRVLLAMTRLGVSVSSLLAEGRPEQAIVENAAKESADLIIMGSHGRNGLDRILMGSVSERVLNQSNCPVLVARS
ncbi:MAG: universal stress protein [Gallionellaceae bacterium]|nr:universal stress protein [Gallionellaceae bacterium]